MKPSEEAIKGAERAIEELENEINGRRANRDWFTRTIIGKIKFNKTEKSLAKLTYLRGFYDGMKFER